MSEDEKLVERVALDVRHARHAGTPEGLRRPSSLDRHISRAAIAAVRAWDAEQGLVTVPREPTEAMLSAGGEAGICDQADLAHAWAAMIRAATPAQQSDGEAG